MVEEKLVNSERSLVDIVESAVSGRFFRVVGNPEIYRFDCFEEVEEHGITSKYILMKNIENPKAVVSTSLYLASDFVEIIPEDMPSLIRRNDGYTDREEKDLRQQGEW